MGDVWRVVFEAEVVVSLIREVLSELFRELFVVKKVVGTDSLLVGSILIPSDDLVSRTLFKENNFIIICYPAELFGEFSNYLNRYITDKFYNYMTF